MADGVGEGVYRSVFERSRQLLLDKFLIWFVNYYLHFGTSWWPPGSVDTHYVGWVGGLIWFDANVTQGGG